MENMENNIVPIESKRAEKLIEKGLQYFAAGELSDAIHCFKDSLEVKQSAEAFTYLGWMLSFNGELDMAIQLCVKAIELDPDYGNPYNDIGTYYMKQGNLEQAVPWLEKAKNAKRYEPRHFPYMNLGRIYLSQGMFLKALAEFEVALKYDPENPELRAVVARIRQKHC